MSGEHEVVHPETLLKQLDALWTEFGKGSDDTSNGVVRACSLTWITVVEGDDAAVYEVDTMLADVMRVHPSRAIVVLLREGDERRLKGSVSAQCWRPFGSKQQVCIERVLLDTTRAGACDLPAVIRALIVADLPVVVFCRNAHLLGLQGIEETSAMADRVVVDIAWKGTECHALWPRMPKLGKYVSDLAWDRIRGFRRAIAEHFASPVARELLPELTELRVYTRAGCPAPEAAYLLTWILGSLGYQYDGDSAQSKEFWRKGESAVKAGFAADDKADAPPSKNPVSAVEFRSAAKVLRFETGMPEPRQNGAMRLPVPCTESDTALLSDEMVVEHRRRTFEHYLDETIRLFEEPVYLADE